jgi:hypothetical protein
VVAIAAARGLPDYPFAVIDHPIAHNDGETLRLKAEQVVDQLVRLLTARRPPEAPAP